MDVILLKDVEKLGAQGSVARVKPGFARNFLVPQGLAVIATSAKLKTSALPSKVCFAGFSRYDFCSGDMCSSVPPNTDAGDLCCNETLKSVRKGRPES